MNMAEKKYYDPWSRMRSINDVPCDELISMLQKSIRRADEKNALGAAYELYMSSVQLADKVWKRLLVISVEDIGFGNVNAPEMIWSLYKMRHDFVYGSADQAMMLVYAIRYLCRCTKERSSDEMKCILADRAKEGFPYEVPDYTYDMHTVKGREMGRGTVHFLQEASKVEPELQAKWVQVLHDAYLNVARLEQESPGEAVVQAYLDTQWDYSE